MRYRVLSLLLSLLVLAGCGGGAVEEPPEIRYGEDACDQCHMIIGEPRFAAAYIAEDGTARRFDDVGEMFLYAYESGETVREAWVHDYDDESWLESDAATFVHDPGLMTPMGWGVAAFRSGDQAEAYRSEHGGVLLSASDLKSRIEEGDLHPGTMSGAHDHAQANHNHNDLVQTHSSHSHEEK